MKNVPHSSRKIKRNPAKSQHFCGTCLVPLLLKRQGEPDAFYYAPTCARCGKTILDFAGANVSVFGWDYGKPRKIATVDGVDFFALDAPALVLCKSCDSSDNKPWTPADCVFMRDQRCSFEIELGDENE